MTTTRPLLPTFDPSRAASGENSAPLSFTQESVWLADRMARQDGPAYNEPAAFRLQGTLRVDLLRQALHQVVERHDALRTSFVETGTGLRAIVWEQVPEFVNVYDLRTCPAQEAQMRAEELVISSSCYPFDLTAAPLLRAALLLLPGDESIVALTIHHLVTDGWSNALLCAEISQHYRSLCASGQPAPLPAPAVSYAHYALKLRADNERGAFDAGIECWRTLLQDGPELLRIPTDFPAPPRQTFAGSSCSLSVPRTQLAALFDTCAQQCRSTRFSVLLAAYAALLQRYTGQQRIAIGTTVLNRGSEELLDVVGCFVNTVPLILDVEEEMTFRALLAQAEQLSSRLLNYGDAPYINVLSSLETAFDPSHNPVFQTMLTLLGERPTLTLGPGITCRPYPVRRVAAKYDVLVYVSEDEDQLEFVAEFNTDLFTQETIERLLRHYALLLTRLAADIDAPLSTVSFLSDAERRLICDVWNGTARTYPQGTVIDLCESQAAQTPDAIAVDYEDQSLTYDQLHRLTNQVAHMLEQQASASPFVGVYMERSLEMLVALLAIVKAGRAYVPIDPTYPAERVRSMIENARLTCILTQEHYQASLAREGLTAITLDCTQRRSEPDSSISRTLTADSPVYMIYTSGSTGRPKGVVNRHVSLFNRLYWMQQAYQLTAEDRVLQKTPFSFDVSVWEFFWPLMSGARLVIARPEGHRDADYLKHLISDRQITTLHFVPSMLHVFLEEEELPRLCASLRRVICSGEALSYRTMEKCFATLGCELHNLYGPTEAAIDVSSWPCSLDYPGNIVPIGRPIANVQLFIVDTHLRLQPIGVPGELCIGGVGLAAGYYRRDDLTQKAFVPNPFAQDSGERLYRTGDLARFLSDGQIQYLGRIDTQVKLRGQRIEPDEISVALQTCPGVRDAVVLVQQNEQSQWLAGYVVAQAFDPQALKAHLRTLLPEYMIPQVLVQIPALPLTANGKLDRRALPATTLSSHQQEMQDDGPQSPAEALLASIWADVLGHSNPGVTANFFRFGGDSLLSIRVVARLRELGYAVQVQDVFAHPTIRALAAVLTERQAEATAASTTPFCLLDPADRAMLPADIEDAWPLTMLQSGMIYHTMLEEETSVYHDLFDYTLAAPVDLARVRQAWRLICARHPQLRAAFDLATFSQPLQLICANAQIPVEIVNLSTLPRPQQDEAIGEWIAAEKCRGFDLERGPLARVQVHLRSAQEINLAFSFHHAILDGWSVSLILEEFRHTYADLLHERTPAPVAEQLPYSAYVRLEQQALGDPQQTAFWLQALGSAIPSVLPHSHDAQAPDPRSLQRPIPQHLAAGLRAFAEQVEVPTRSVYLALHLHALGQVLGESRLVSGLVTHGRPEEPGGDALAGLFLNTVPFPIELRTDEGWPDVVRRVLQAELNAIAYRRFPLAEIQRRSGVDAWFDTVFNYTDFYLYRDGSAGDVRFLAARYFEYTSFDVVVHAHHDHFTDQWLLLVNYQAAHIATDVVERYLEAYLAAAADLVGADGQVGTDPLPPTELERQIAAIVAQAIGVPDLGPDDNYLDLGMDSITAIRVVARIKKLRSGLSMKDMFAYPTVRQLAQQLAPAESPAGNARGPLRPFELAGQPAHLWSPGIIDAYPATLMQLHMIRATSEDPQQAAYHDVFSYRLALPFQQALLQACVFHVVNLYDILRTGFALDRSPLQVVYETVHPTLEVFDLGELPAEQQQAAFDTWFEQEKQRGFDWAQPGLLRFAIHRWGADEFTLTISFHHAILDGWSLSLFIRELVTRYLAGISGTVAPQSRVPGLRFREYVNVELQSREARAAQDFWRATLRGYRPSQLPQLASRSNPARWCETRILLDDMQQEALAQLCTQLAVPMKHVLLAVHVRMVSLLCQESDVVTGVFSSGRLEEDEGEEVIGLFLNFLPLRQLVASQTWSSFIQEVFANDRQSLPYRRYPLATIERDLNAEPLFATLFNYTRFKAYSDLVSAAPGRVLTGVRWFEHTAAPLLVNVGYDIWQERTLLTVHADGRVLSQASVELVARLYIAVLDQLCERIDGALAETSGVIDDLMTALSEQRKEQDE